MRVDIWSDVVCPWCYIGKARFEQALSDFTHRDEVEVVFRSFELDPDYLKDEHQTAVAMLSSKYGIPEAQARAADARVAGLAAAEGLGFDSDRPVGNTFDTHRVIHLGREKGVQQELITAVNEAYFAHARQVFDRDVITEVAAGAGLDVSAVREDELEARQLRISGVPFFVFDMTLGVSGAQPAETFTSALNQAWARRG